LETELKVEKEWFFMNTEKITEKITKNIVRQVSMVIGGQNLP
jgi:hypothetical protein